ncbi:hypothetical protein KAW50_06075 [candidate division WOR-3 bacterium]|nr:hypothetical protein [candidate division WOR-3 bacterium]
MKNNIFSLSTLYFLLSTSLYAVEGNEPVPELELPVLEVKISEDSLQDREEVAQFLHFPQFSLGLEFGESELGEGYNIEIGGYTGINNSFAAQFLEVDDKSSFGAGTELRVIGRQSIVEIDAETRRYKIGDGYWENLYLANSSISLYLGENVFKILASSCYESETLWDIGVLWGKRFLEPLFMGVGISAPIVAPFVQMDWRVNDFFSINISHRSKTVTRPLENIYMNQLYVVQNPGLKHEHWNSLSEVEFLFGENINIGFSHKLIENIIYWSHPYHFHPRNIEAIKPINGGKHCEWGGGISLGWQKIKNTTSLKFIPLKIHPNPPKCIFHTFLPTISFVNSLEISLPYEMGIKLESKYIEKKFYLAGMDVGTMFDYWLFSFGFSKKLKNWELGVKINNLTNTKYQIIRWVEGPGRCIQAGFNIRM